MATLAAVLAGKLVDAGSGTCARQSGQCVSAKDRLTVAHAMTLLAAIVAHHDRTFGLDLVLGTVLGGVSKLLAVVALGLAHPGDNVTSIGQSLQDLVMVLGPTLSLRLTKRSVDEAVVDSVLLAEVALKVHVGHGNGETGTLLGDEVKAPVVAAKSNLKLDEGGRGVSLGINLNHLLDIVHILVHDGLLKKLPSVLGRQVTQVAAVDLAGVRAISGHMLCIVLAGWTRLYYGRQGFIET